MALLASIAAIVSLLLTSDRKSSRCSWDSFMIVEKSSDCVLQKIKQERCGSTDMADFKDPL